MTEKEFNKIQRGLARERKEFEKSLVELEKNEHYKKYLDFLKSQKEYFRDMLETEKNDVRYFQGVLYMINYLLDLSVTLENERKLTRE